MNRKRQRVRPRHLFWAAALAFGVTLAVAGFLRTPEVAAFESYHDPALADAGYCTSCHTGFAAGKNDTTHKLHTGGTSALGTITSNCDLCHTGSGRDNPLTLWSAEDDAVTPGLGCAGCHGRDYGETIGANHQGFPITGLPKAGTWGLRQKHQDSGVPGTAACQSCHGTSTTPLSEDIEPPYYARADVNVSDSCADLLDNDGDGLLDAADPDCVSNVAPTSDPNGPYTGTTGIAVAFDGSGSSDSDGSIVSYDWDFGDTTTGTGMSPTHAYAGSGTFTVTLTVTDNDGATDTDTTTATINAPPTADAGGLYNGFEGVAVSFDGTGSSDNGSIVSYDWDFGDGSTGTGMSPTHTYATAGLYTVTLTVTDNGPPTLTDTATTVVSIAVVSTPQAPDTVGLVDISQGMWYLRNSAGVVTSFFYGNPGDLPIAGDWDGDGTATPGLYRQSDGFFYARNSNTQGPADAECFAGDPSDVPVVGDWDGDGDDNLGIYRPSEQKFYLFTISCTGSPMGAAQISFLFGNPGDNPVAGDWDADGITEVGLHRESTGFFYWRNTLDTGIASGQIFFGDPNDRFVAGDWGLVDGIDTPAIFRPSDLGFYFRHTLTQGVADSQFTWTGAGSGWLPVSGAFGLG